MRQVGCGEERARHSIKGSRLDWALRDAVAASVTLVSWFPLLIAVIALVAVWSFFSVAIVFVLRDRHEAPIGRETPALIVLVAGLALATGFLGLGTYAAYSPQAAWTFAYSVSIRTNGTSPESVVVPMWNDESLLTGLQVTAGTANWSFVDTANGRGLYVAFMGPATLESNVVIVPAPSPAPNAGPTLEVPYNPITSDYRWWVFYNGEAGGTLTLNLGCYALETSLVPGWTTAAPSCPNPQLPPLA